MKFIKVLINSIIAGYLFSILLSLLIIDLNLYLVLDLSFLLKVSIFIFIIYGSLVILLLIFSFFVYNFFSAKKIDIAFPSPSFLILSFSFLFLIFAEIFWANYKYYQSFFNQTIDSIIHKQIAVIIFLGVAGIIFYFLYYSYRRKKVFFITYFLLFSLLFPFIFIWRNDYPYFSERKEVAHFKAKKLDKKVIIIGFEGSSFDFIIPLISEGKLPNFAWLMDKGSWGALKNLTPCEPITYHASFKKGKYPAKHFQFSSYFYQLDKIEPAINIVPRYIFIRQLEKVGLLKVSSSSPRDRTKGILEILKENGTITVDHSWPREEIVNQNPQKTFELFSLFFEDLLNNKNWKAKLVKKAFYQDNFNEEYSYKLKNDLTPYLFYLFLNGLNKIKPYLYKYSRPELFGNVNQEDVIRYGKIIEKYYQYYDQIVGKYLSSLKENELLIIYSPHGVEPLPLWKRFIEWGLGNKELSAYYDSAPDGVIFFYGSSIARGKNIEEIKLVDLAPTILYYFGLPIGKDMDGVVVTSIFKEEFTAENPIFYISSYDEILIR